MKRKYVLIVIGSSLLFGVAATEATSSNSTYSSLSISPTAIPTNTRSIKDCNLKGKTPITTPTPVPNSENVKGVSSGELSNELTPQEVENALKQMDSDKDGVCDYADNCEEVYNPKQEDKNKNGIGDVCEPRSKRKLKKRKS